MQGLISLQFGGFPPGYCYGSPDDFATDLLTNTTISFNTSTGNLYYNFGATVPSVDNRIYPWYRTETNDGFEGWYFWGGDVGIDAWIAPHPVPASSDIRMLWVGAEADLETFDGGDALAPTTSTGPFWEVDTAFAARSPIAPGTTANGTIVTVATNYGDDEYDLTLEKKHLPDHYHHINIEGDSPLAPEREADGYLRVGAGTEVDWQIGSGPKNGMAKTYAEIDDGTITQEAATIPTITPARGAYVIKRTTRVYRRGS